MPFKPKSVHNTNKVNTPKTSQPLSNLKARIQLLKRIVLAVIQRNTREKTAHTRTKFAVFAKSRDTSKVHAEKRSRKTRTAQLTMSKKSAKMHRLSIVQVQLHPHHHFTYDYPLQLSNIR